MEHKRISHTDLISRRKKVEIVSVEEKTYLLHPESNVLVEINTTGTFIWNLLKNVVTLEAVQASLLNHYVSPKDESIIQKELIDFLTVLQDQDFLVIKASNNNKS